MKNHVIQNFGSSQFRIRSICGGMFLDCILELAIGYAKPYNMQRRPIHVVRPCDREKDMGLSVIRRPKLLRFWISVGLSLFVEANEIGGQIRTKSESSAKWILGAGWLSHSTQLIHSVIRMGIERGWPELCDGGTFILMQIFFFFFSEIWASHLFFDASNKLLVKLELKNNVQVVE